MRTRRGSAFQDPDSRPRFNLSQSSELSLSGSFGDLGIVPQPVALTRNDSLRRLENIKSIEASLVRSVGDLPIVAKVKAGNLQSLKFISVNDIYEADVANENGKGRNLIREAIAYNQASVIQYLINQLHMPLPTSDAELDELFLALFTERGSYAPISKSKQSTIEIYQAMRGALKEQNNDYDPDKSGVCHKALLSAAKGDDEEIINVILQVSARLRENINKVDGDGHTAYFYIAASTDMSASNKENFIRVIEENGGRLNDKDKIVLRQNEFEKKFMHAIENDNNQANNMLSELIKNRELMRPEQFYACLMTCVSSISSENPSDNLLMRMLQMPQMSEIEDFEDLFKAICHPNAARLLFAHTVKQETVVDRSNFTTEQNISDQFKQASHRIGLTGSITSINQEGQDKTYELDGNLAHEGFNYLADSLSGYQPANQDAHHYFDEIRSAVRFTNQMMLVGSTDAKAAIFTEQYRKGELIVIPTGWHGHVVGLNMKYDGNETMITLSNRGDGDITSCIPQSVLETMPEDIQVAIKDNPSGTIVLRKQGQVSQPDEFLKYLLHKSNRSNYSDMTKMTEFQQRTAEYLRDFTGVAYMPARPQSKGTCSFVNPKRSIEGALYMMKVMNEKRIPDGAMLDEIYKIYKEYSINDKLKAARELAHFYQNYCNSPHPESDQHHLDALNTLMIKAIVMHNDSKNKSDHDIHIGRLLYQVLQPEAKEKVDRLIQNNLLKQEVKSQLTSTPFNLFQSRHANLSREREIRIKGDVEDLLKYGGQAQLLLEYLQKKGCSSKEIRSIKLDAKTKFLIIETAPSRETKYKVRDEVNEKGLGMAITNVDGKFEFKISYNELVKFGPKLSELSERDHQSKPGH